MRTVFLTLIALASLIYNANIYSAVGYQQFKYTDESRRNWSNTAARPMFTYVWYPAAANSEIVEISFPLEQPIFLAGKAAKNAPLLTNDKTYPLVVMSHGTGGSGLQMMWLGRRLAEAGFISAAVNHHGNTAAETHYDARGFRLFWERTTDLSKVIDRLLSEPMFEDAIDLDRIAAIGFSLGGYTVTALAGGRIDLDQFEQFCASGKRDATCGSQNEFPEADIEFQKLIDSDPRVKQSIAKHKHNYHDPRIKAAIALAPALGAAFTQESLNNIQIPMYFIAGEMDRIAPAQTNAQHLTQSIPNAQFKIAHAKAGHYIFLNSCTEHGRQYISLCQDDEEIEREEIHDAVTCDIIDWLIAHL